MKRVVVLGSSGSIGRSALRVAAALPDRLRVIGLAVERNVEAALKQAEEFGVTHVAVVDPAAAARAAAAAPRGVRVWAGRDGLLRLAALEEADIVLCAVVGMAGLEPVLAALDRGATVALATKEVLVSAGGVVMERAARRHARVLPVDSEHSAIFQCLEDRRGPPPWSAGPGPAVARIVLTASGGPFAGRPDVDLDRVSVADALNHPQWKMGRKVTVDSATLMNKGLEIIEAHWMFGTPIASIGVVLHPESLVHSLVEFVDGTLLAQLSVPDMRFAIQYALTWPERVDGGLPSLDLCRAGALHFGTPDERRFPCLALARRAGLAGGTMPAVLNAANEVAVRKFLDGRIRFTGIWRTVERVLDRHAPDAAPDLGAILAADAWARREAEEIE